MEPYIVNLIYKWFPNSSKNQKAHLGFMNFETKNFNGKTKHPKKEIKKKTHILTS